MPVEAGIAGLERNNHSVCKGVGSKASPSLPTGTGRVKYGFFGCIIYNGDVVIIDDNIMAKNAFENYSHGEATEAHPEEPQEKKSADIVYIPTYMTYSAIGGHMTKKEYETVSLIAGTETPVNNMYKSHAQTNAEVVGITLSDDVLDLYARLRDYRTPDVPNTLAIISDQELLAEVLRFKGNGSDVEKMKVKLPHIPF